MMEPPTSPLDIIESRVRALETKVNDHDASLKVGAATFNDLRENIINKFGEVKADIGELRPKPRNERETVFFLVGLAITIGGGIWGFGAEFSSRPTKDEVAKMLAAHESGIHPGTTIELKALQQQLTDQKVLTDRLNTQEQIMKSELDDMRAELRSLRSASVAAPNRK